MRPTRGGVSLGAPGNVLRRTRGPAPAAISPLFPTRADTSLDRAFFEDQPNRPPELLPDAADWAHAVRVFDPKGLKLHANCLKQKVVCYLDKEAR